MTDAEFRDWLADEVVNGRMTPAQQTDILRQKVLFDADRVTIEQLFQGMVAGYVGDKRLVADSVEDLFNLAANFAHDRMVYFEPIGFVLF